VAADTPGSFLPEAEARVVLGHKDPSTMVGFQWSGSEPEGLYDTEEAVALGAVWEDDELVCYNLAALEHAHRHHSDEWMEDSD
jgi:hypothetical protein